MIGSEVTSSPENVAKLDRAVGRLKDIFTSPNFPEEFRPEDGWGKRLKILPDQAYEDNIIELARKLHLFTSPQNQEAIERAYRAFIKASFMRNDFLSRDILIKESPFVNRPADASAITLAHELGHNIVQERIEPLGSTEAHQRGPILGEFYGKNFDPSQLKLHKRGLLQWIEFDGKQLEGFPNSLDFQGDFLDELYADIYRNFVLVHWTSLVRGGIPFKQALAEHIKSHRGTSGKGSYHDRVLQYADDMGWEDLIRAGAASDIEAFINVGNQILGQERNKKVLQAIVSSRSDTPRPVEGTFVQVDKGT